MKSPLVHMQYLILKKTAITASVVAYLLLVGMLDPPPFILINKPFSAQFWICQNIMVSQGPPPCSQLYSINPPSLYLFIKCVLNHIPSKMAPKF